MGFIDSYKHLEKLCDEICHDDRRVSAYIDEMLNTPRGSYLINGWDDDLKHLKRYRWIRNKIVHEPDCTEQNMSEPHDAAWLDDFYSRILNQTDPLSLYAKAVQPQKTTQAYTTGTPADTYTQLSVMPQRSSQKPLVCLFLFLVIITFLFLAAIIFIAILLIRL